MVLGFEKKDIVPTAMFEVKPRIIIGTEYRHQQPATTSRLRETKSSVYSAKKALTALEIWSQQYFFLLEKDKQRSTL